MAGLLPNAMSPLHGLITQKRTLVVVGPGGVGKTTTSASLALQAARQGKTVLVLTVDPARRLASSLGLSEMSHEAVRVDDALFQEAGLSCEGALYAMMLDTKRTFDALIERHAPSDAIKERIFANPFYQQAAGAMAGTQEYMAMEKLYEVRHEREGFFDLIVLDTAPTTSALDFLTAADRLGGFLGSNALQGLLSMARKAGRMGFGLLKVNNFLVRRLTKMVSMETLLGLLEFLESFQQMHRGFADRAQRVKALLHDDRNNAFVVVGATEDAVVDELCYFHDTLREHGMPVGSVVLNRVRQPREGAEHKVDLPAEAMALAAKEPTLGDAESLDRVIGTMVDLCADYQRQVDRDLKAVQHIRDYLSPTNAGLVQTVPWFERDVHSLKNLASFADVLVPLRG